MKRESKEIGYCAKCIVFILSKRIKVCNKIDGIAPCIGIEDYGSIIISYTQPYTLKENIQGIV